MRRHEIRRHDTRTATHPLDAVHEYAATGLLERVGDEGRSLVEVACELLERLVADGDLQRLRRGISRELHRARHDGEDVGDSERSVR